MNKEFIIWFTGFWEGEGSFFLNEKDRGCSLSVSQSGERGEKVISFIKSQFDEILSYSNHLTYKYKNPKYKLCHIFTVSNRMDMIKVIKLMLPHLKFRKEEIKSALKKLKKWEEEGKAHRWNKEEINFLKENYKKRTDDELSKLLPRHTKKTIVDKRLELNLRKHKAHKFKFNFTERELRKLYWGQKLSLLEIGKIKKCHDVTVLNWMKKFNIPLRTLSEALRNSWKKGLR